MTAGVEGIADGQLIGLAIPGSCYIGLPFSAICLLSCQVPFIATVNVSQHHSLAMIKKSDDGAASRPAVYVCPSLAFGLLPFDMWATATSHDSLERS